MTPLRAFIAYKLGYLCVMAFTVPIYGPWLFEKSYSLALMVLG